MYEGCSHLRVYAYFRGRSKAFLHLLFLRFLQLEPFSVDPFFGVVWVLIHHVLCSSCPLRWLLLVAWPPPLNASGVWASGLQELLLNFFRAIHPLPLFASQNWSGMCVIILVWRASFPDFYLKECRKKNLILSWLTCHRIFEIRLSLFPVWFLLMNFWLWKRLNFLALLHPLLEGAESNSASLAFLVWKRPNVTRWCTFPAFLLSLVMR